MSICEMFELEAELALKSRVASEGSVVKKRVPHPSPEINEQQMTDALVQEIQMSKNSERRALKM